MPPACSIREGIELECLSSCEAHVSPFVSQIWFQNRRARHSAQQSSSGPVSALAAVPDPRPQPTDLQVPVHLSPVPSSSHGCPPWNPPGSALPFAAAPPPHLSARISAHQGLSGACGSLCPVATLFQPTQGVCGGPISHPPQNLQRRAHTGTTVGVAVSPTHTPLWTPEQGTRREPRGKASLPFQGSPRPHPDNHGHRWQHVGQLGASPTLLGWAQVPQVGGAGGEPREGAGLPPAPTETHLWQRQAPSNEESSPLPPQQQQSSSETWGLLDELLSSTEIRQAACPFLSSDLQPVEPLGTPEVPLSHDEFQALLDMLLCSPRPPR